MVSYTRKIKNTRAVLLTVMMALLMCVPLSAFGRMVGTFQGNQPSVTVDFDAAGTVDKAAVIPWNYTATTLHATVNITPSSHTNHGPDYPLSPSINVGNQGAPEWAYSGQGYGAYGMQTVFKDNSTSYSKELIEAGALYPPQVLLPTDAQIDKAYFQLKGEPANVNYSDNFFAYNGVYKVAYSKTYNTVFLGGNNFGVIAKNLNDGTYRRFNTDTYPGIPEGTINAIFYDDATNLLFIGTNGGLQIIDYMNMTPVEVLDRFSDLNTLTNNIYSVNYNAKTGILVVGESGDIAVYNYTSRAKLGFVDVSFGTIVYDLEMDPTNDRVWAGTSWGVYGVSLADLQVKYRYSTTTTPSIPGYYAQSVVYDAQNDRLVVGTRSPGNNPGGLTIINVQAGTKFGEITDVTAVALPNRYVWAVSFGKTTNTVYAATEGGVGVYTLSPLAQVTRYNFGSTPPILHTYDQDLVYDKDMDYMIVGTWGGVSVIDVGHSKKIMDITKLSENPYIQQAAIQDVAVDQSLGLAIIPQYYSLVSILNLSSSQIEVNLTPANFMGGHTCDYLNRIYYAQDRHWLLTACLSNTWPVHPALGVYNVSSKKFVTYYDDTTTPALLAPPGGWAGQVLDLDYNSQRNVVLLCQYGAGMLLLNMTSNTTYAITTATPNPMRYQYQWGNYDAVYCPDRSLIILANYNFGVSIFNYSSNQRYDITGATNPSIYIYPVRIVMDMKTNYIYVGGYNGLDVFNITNPAGIKLVARYNQGTNPSIPQTYFNSMHFDAAEKMVYMATQNGAYGLDITLGTTSKRYTTTTSPFLFQANTYGFTDYKAKKWDVLATASVIQLIKPDPTPMDPELWLGNTMVWSRLGPFNTTVGIGDLGTKVQLALDKAQKRAPDGYGVSMSELKLRLVTQRAGTLTFDNVSITYKHTSTTPDLSSAINSYIATAGPSWDGTVPIAVSSGSAGKITLDALKVNIDEAPFFSKLPDNLWIYENSFQGHLLDINNYVKDDYDLKTDLKFKATVLTNSTRVDVGIFDGHFVYIDAQSKPESVNWTGTVKVQLTATDTRGLSRNSDPFLVTVKPVKAIVITSTPVTVVLEDTAYSYDVKAVSHRALPLTYMLDKAPAGMKIDNITGAITWAPVNDDVGDHEIIINVSDGTDWAHQTYVLSVINVNDAPLLSTLPDLTVYEGVAALVDMSKYVKDVDDPTSNLTVIAKSSYATVNGLSILLSYPLKSGIKGENISLTVSDGKAMVSGVLKVKVQGVFKVDQIPDQKATEGTSLSLDIASFIHDPQGKKLTITASSAHAKMNKTTLEILYNVGSKVTEENITVKVSDGTTVNDTTVRFKVSVTAVFPTVTISTPTTGTKVSGKLTVSGTAAIPSGQVTKVMVRIDNGEWVQATGTTSWTYEAKLKDLKLKDGVHYIYVQSYSNNVTSTQAYVDFTVKNPTPARISSESYLGLGLIIGIIIAIVIGVVAYSMGKRKRGEAQETHPGSKSFEPMDEEASGPRAAPIKQTRPPRPEPEPVKEEVVPEPPKVEEPTAPKEEVIAAVAVAPVPEEKPSDDKVFEELTQTVESPKEETVDFPSEPKPETPKEATPSENKPQPGPPSENKDNKGKTDLALSEILAKLDR